DSDDLACQVDETELLQQGAPVGFQSPPVGPNQSANLVDYLVALYRGWNEFVDRHDQRRVADDPWIAIDHMRKLLEGTRAVPGARLGDVGLRLLQPLGVDAAGKLLERLFNGQAGVPDIQV